MTAAREENGKSRLEGIVIRAYSGQCVVVAEDETYMCRLRGRLRKGERREQTVVVVGDRVRLTPVGDDGSRHLAGVIDEICPRRNRISRQAARRSGGGVEQVLMANLDQVVAVQSVAQPKPIAGFVDRLMVAAERYGVAGVICLNKCDLDTDSAADTCWDYYGQLGYRLVRTSAETGLGLDEFSALLADRLSILLGVSGVGKTSLLNATNPGLDLRIGDVTERTGLGRHTTTRTELFPLAGGGFIADSPGIRGFDPWEIAPEDLRDYFPDFVEPGGGCRFRSCIHRDEPGCGVKDGVRRGNIPEWRYEAYLALLSSLEDRQHRTRRSPGK